MSDEDLTFDINEQNTPFDAPKVLFNSVPHLNKIVSPKSFDNYSKNILKSKSFTPADLSYDKNGFVVTYQPLNDEIKVEKPHPDLVAMSVLSLYESAQDIEKDMDTSRDVGSGDQNDSKDIPDNSNEIPTNCDVKENLITNNYNNSTIGNSPSNSSLFFRDGMRSVDFVLVWDELIEEALTEIAIERRHVFETNLMKEGLELEYEPVESNGLHFIKIHAPLEVLRRYSEILKLRMPMKEDLCIIEKCDRHSAILEALSQKIPGLQEVQARTNVILDKVSSYWDKIMSRIYVDRDIFPHPSQRFTAVFSRDKEYLFDLESPDFFTPAIHSRIVQFILDRKRFSDDARDDFAFGIERLINYSTYSAAYPLHDGDLRTPGSKRYLLYTHWASLWKSHRYQPLDCVKDYFGVKIGLYFAWLGFYTHMLLPAAVVGLACFAYSWATLYDNKPSEDICNGVLDLKMCPLCDYWCDYWNIKETCLHARITYLFDNSTTVFFALFMSFWAALFLELWKRYSAEITHRWDLSSFDVQEEHPRPQYLARLAHIKRTRVNIVTNTMEPHVPFWRMRLPATVFSFSVVLLLVALAVAAVLAVIIYRIALLSVLSWYKDSVITSYALLFTTATAATLNLFCIMIFNWIYTFVAEYLTEIELLRTQTEFDDSLTLKIYLLQFVNYYASIFYIAFFKGRFVGYPGGYNRFFGFRQEECGPGGCLMELCIQLAIIMVGKQIMNTVLEMIMPLFWKWINSMRVRVSRVDGIVSPKKQWVRDFKLIEWGSRGLFPEYLEMVLQYGFVTIFVAAFPLAPFFALLNNILEMRLDGKKLLTYYRRPVTQRVRDIGVWYRILDSIGKLSVITNGFIIAFTSDFIPRLVYKYAVSKNGTLEGYLNNSLSYFETDTFSKTNTAPYNTDYNETLCRYPDYREPPGTDNSYERNTLFWHIMAARFAFVVVFENAVVIVMILVRWCVPDMAAELRDRIRRESYITNEIIIKRETMRARAAQLGQHPVSGGSADDETRRVKWRHVLNTSLTGQDFDLLLHGHGSMRHRPNSGSSIAPVTSV